MITTTAPPPTLATMEGPLLTMDASNHSVCTPIPTEEDDERPLSPNSISQFPENVSAHSKHSVSTHSRRNVSIHSMKSCHLPTPVCEDENEDDESSVCSIHCDELDDELFDGVDESFSSSDSSIYKSSVQFSPLVRVKDTISRHDMSLKEHYGYWLQDHEFLMIKQRNQKTIHEFEAQQKDSEHQNDFGPNPHTRAPLSDDGEEDCLRGLENGLRFESLRRKSYRFAAIEEVLLEQEDQYFADIYDDEAIAQVYFEVTAECRFRAEFRALQDRKEVEDYLEEGLVIETVHSTNFSAVPHEESDTEDSEGESSQDTDDGDEFAIE